MTSSFVVDTVADAVHSTVSAVTRRFAASPLRFAAIVCAASVAALGFMDWWRHRNACPGVAFWPFLGHLPAIITHQDTLYEFMDSVFQASDRPAVLMRFTWMKFVLTRDPRDVKRVLGDNWENYQVSIGQRSEALTDLFGRGIFNSDGAHWLLQRKLSSREFS